MYKIIIALPVSLSIILNCAAAESRTRELMVIGKMTGACGILGSMVHFQSTTGLDGGDEFVTRFWATEAARLGISDEQLAERCKKSIATYNRITNTLDELGE